jgi:hypothetical protein
LLQSAHAGAALAPIRTQQGMIIRLKLFIVCFLFCLAMSSGLSGVIPKLSAHDSDKKPITASPRSIRAIAASLPRHGATMRRAEKSRDGLEVKSSKSGQIGTNWSILGWSEITA